MIVRRPDEKLRGLDVEAAITAGLPDDDARHTMFSDAAIVASHQAEQLGVGSYPLAFLAGCVRSMGLCPALELPEPLIGAEPTELVRRWMSAAVEGADSNIERDELFARWLERVAMLIAVRRQVGSRATPETVTPGTSTDFLVTAPHENPPHSNRQDNSAPSDSITRSRTAEILGKISPPDNAH